MNAKIQPHHLSRPAIVYIRQSTLTQVYEHRESTERQYALAELARHLGWDASQVQVVDEDLGQSGGSTADRTGFQRVVAEVSLGRVGAIVALEVSRLSRSSADWHRLLDLCSLSATLIIDNDGVYDPNDFNDRLVLGMKGTMSDAERHFLRLRLNGGKHHKAHKGLLAFLAPTGYQFEDRGALTQDPDEEVQKAVRLLFERFRVDGTAYGVVQYFRRHGLRYPSRHQHKDAPADIVWKVLTVSRVLETLRNPFYAGTYVYGRRPYRRVVVGDTVRTRRDYHTPREQWEVMIHDAHPGYITWEQHLANLRQLHANRTSRADVAQRGAPRRGTALLQGLVLCGRCGRRMRTAYPRAQNPVYVCRSHADGGGTCWSAPTPPIDAVLVATVLAAVSPVEIDLSLAVVHEVERQAATVDRQWRLRLERARYEAERAARQFHAVEPENRLVARTLEARWNEKLRDLEQAERDYERARQTHALTLTPEDRAAALALATDLPQVWSAATTTVADRKRILRLLIEDIVLAPIEVPTRGTSIRVLWKTGATQDLTAARLPSTENWKTRDDVLTAIRSLAAAHQTDDQIAAALNTRGLRSGHGRAFTERLVQTLRGAYGIRAARGWGTGQPLAERDARGRYSVRGLAVHYHITEGIVRYWLHRGVITMEQDVPQGPRWIDLTPEVEAVILAALRRGYGSRNQRKNQPAGPPAQQEINQ